MSWPCSIIAPAAGGPVTVTGREGGLGFGGAVQESDGLAAVETPTAVTDTEGDGLPAGAPTTDTEGDRLPAAPESLTVTGREGGLGFAAGVLATTDAAPECDRMLGVSAKIDEQTARASFTL
jgi:hypothetical protein